MRYKQHKHYFMYGLRAPARLLKPRMIPMGKFNLPLESIYHYFEGSQAIVGPSPQERVFQTEGGRLFIEHVKTLDSMVGNPRRTVLSPVTLENDYRRLNRIFKPVRKDEAVTIMNKNVMVVNYNMLNPLYRYVASFKANYYRWYNNQVTFWNKVSEVSERFPHWNQYIELELPPTVPTRGKWNQIQTTISQTTLGEFPTPAHLTCVDLFKWLGPKREDSLMSALTDQQLDKINLIFNLRTHWFTLNLGLLNKWRKGTDNAKGINPAELQVRFVKLLNGLYHFTKDGTELDEDEEGLALDLEDKVEDTVPVDSTVKQKTRVKEQQVVDSEPPSVDEGITEDDLTGSAELDLFEGLDLDIESPEPLDIGAIDSRIDIDELDSDEIDAEAAATGQTLSDITDDEEEEEPTSFADQLLQDPNVAPIALKAFDMAETGVITHRAMNRSIEDALSYKQLPDPYNTGKPIAEAMVLNEDDLTLPEAKRFPDSSVVLDKSMLSSKLKDLNKKYIKQVMHKDILNSVIAVQKQGVAIKDYKMEVVRDAMNHYEIHAVTIKPIRGRQTTVRFRIPVVDADGRFTSNGTLYSVKTQRADVPIRKINSTRVALTSYYNKTFVDRSARKVDNYERWLLATIKASALDNNDNTITNIRLGACFAAEEKLPRLYTLLSKEITEFRSGEYTFYLDYYKRADYFTAKGIDVKAEEPKGHVVIGHKGKQAVCIDGNNVLYLSTPEGQEPLGMFTEVVGIPTDKAPTEMAEMTVQNKVITVGLVLAYYYGLGNLLKALNVEHSRHPRGERIQLTNDEYRIVFQDEVLVLSKLDTRSTLILNGLNRYHRVLKQFSIWEFDKKDVYYRVLEDAGMGVRYIRELDALKNAWMDPITEGLLKDMGEPTEYDKLLVRAVELLLIDYTPKEVDPAFMRYRGYERFAGTIYSELSRAVKSFNNRATVGEIGVELNPYAVWQKIVQDPSVGIVEEANPIANLREQESFTYRGDGGRSSVSMVERTRVYHDNDVGTVSESTVDSGDVGVIAYLSPDANLVNLRGITRPFAKDDGPSKIFSSSALLAPAVDHDDCYQSA